MPAVPSPVNPQLIRQGIGLLVLAIVVPYRLNQARKGAGLGDVQVFEQRGWICPTGRRPAA